MIYTTKNTLKNPLVKQALQRWAERSIRNPLDYDEIDWDAETDGELTLHENTHIIQRSHPLAFDENQAAESIKKLVVIKSLIPKILSGEVECTYRKNTLHGLYYLVTDRFRPSEPKIFIEAFGGDNVDPYSLSDADAQTAGVSSAKELLSLLEAWYGKPLPKIYRNWFRVKASLG